MQFIPLRGVKQYIANVFKKYVETLRDDYAIPLSAIQ